MGNVRSSRGAGRLHAIDGRAAAAGRLFIRASCELGVGQAYVQKLCLFTVVPQTLVDPNRTALPHLRDPHLLLLACTSCQSLRFKKRQLDSNWGARTVEQ